MTTIVGRTRNDGLHRARRARDDEFYTRLSDVEAEVDRYWDLDAGRNPFAGRTVLLCCDDPATSSFWRYFADRFELLDLGRLVAVRYALDGGTGDVTTLERDGHGTPTVRAEQLAGDGDFRSEECLALLDAADVVVTNPPFSLFRELVGLLVSRGKRFLLLGNQNAITYKEIFGLVRSGRLWLGCRSGDMAFRVPDDSPPRATRFWIDDDGQRWRSLGNACWFTNLDHDKRHEELPLTRRYAEDPDAWPAYDNADAINVDRVADIPADFAGAMGVPITFLHRYNPDQFEIVRFRHGDDGTDLRHGGRTPYFRILVRNRRPQPATPDRA